LFFRKEKYLIYGSSSKEIGMMVEKAGERGKGGQTENSRLGGGRK